MAPAGTIVSLFSSRISSPLLARIPTLFAAANPVFDGCAISRTSGQPRRTAATLSSADALSTTMMSCGIAGGAAVSDARQRSRSARAL